jgi:5-methylcytosine-specific restriction endonuclease McrA
MPDTSEEAARLARIVAALRRDEIRRFNRQCPVDYEDYSQYLRSSHWASVRRRARARAGDRCERCGVPRSEAVLHVHHLTYEHLGAELDDELQVLCESCHQEAHDEWDPFAPYQPRERDQARQPGGEHSAST